VAVSEGHIQAAKDKLAADLEAGEISAEAHLEGMAIVADAEEEELEESKRRAQEKAEAWMDATDLINDTAQSVMFSMIEISNNQTQTELDNIDKQTQATLEALGLQEETKIESLERQRAKAIEDGDLTTAAELQDSIDRQKIIEEAEEEKAIVKYEGAVEEWELRKTMALVDFAAATIKTFATMGFTPWAWAAVAAGGVMFGAQMAALESAKPQKPSFETGGTFIADQPQLIQVGEGAGSERVTVEQTGGSSAGPETFRLISGSGDMLGWIQREGFNNGNLRVPKRNII